MATLSSYLQNWKIKLSKTKTVATPFHLNNRKAKRELKIIADGNGCPTTLHHLSRDHPGQHPDISTPFGDPAQETYITRGFICRLAGTGCEARTTTLRITTVALVYSTAEHCVAHMYKVAVHIHTCLTDLSMMPCAW